MADDPTDPFEGLPWAVKVIGWTLVLLFWLGCGLHLFVGWLLVIPLGLWWGLALWFGPWLLAMAASLASFKPKGDR